MSATFPDPRDRLIIALDLPSVSTAESIIARIGDAATFYKIGYELGFAGGLGLARELVADGKKVFIDFKLHDIGNTVARGVASLAALGASFATVHAYPQTMRAAMEGKGASPLRILAVTVLTSYDEADLAEAGYAGGVAATVASRVAQAREIGVDGIVCAPTDAASVRTALGAKGVIVTPGVRPDGAATGDQKRVATPFAAIRAGADYLVVGRPIVASPDPGASARAVQAEIARAVA
ncbi:Orotidine 5'-phosphate decarboxylase [Starkeya nomas]|uniref:Orotidine 5'-phosphate decarboxylase n=2 Tax=Xanthobacteraceae TaxID=335928 RepID=A0A5S9Q3I3_9HYPH|nr:MULTISPECIES: orotidine-5'-phosphate decarboxylase [Xanthobacteraceae]TSJ64389.1 orotidine-5'-phosphate decarboxylase [Ancylobacter moscoviensis]CAA0112115.1 Orotidine 5'-phosphate decarboxylase [Starkeya nomas]